MGSISSILGALSGSSSSTSAADISSILQALYGASSSGIDVSSAVSAGVTSARQAENAWNSELSTLQSQSSALQTLESNVSSLDNDVQSLNSLTGALASRTVTSSNSGLVTASAAPGSTLGNHVVVVNNLATTASWTSGVFANGTTDLPAGNFTITTGGGGTATITTDGTQTLTDVANQINTDNLGITANVITDASGSRLALVSNSSGTANNFTITGSAGFGFTQAATGQNASLSVDGINISSASNTVTGVVSGLTLNLQGASAGAEVSLNVSPNTSSASSQINQFVTDYNTVVTSLNSQFTFTAGSGEGILATDPTVRSLQSDLLSMVNYTNTPASGTTTVPNLSSLGITVNNDGTLSVDSATLQDALSNNFGDVQTFFQGATLNGFANSVDQTLTNYTNASNGAFTVDLKSISSQATDLNTDISNYETNVITPLQAQLQTEYTNAQNALEALSTTKQQINELLGYNNSNG